MKVYVVQYWGELEGESYWTFDKVFSNEDKAQKYCKEKNSGFDFPYEYKECELE